MDAGSARVIAVTEGEKEDVRLQVALVAHTDGRVETLVNYVGVGARTLVEGEEALMTAHAVGVYNEAVETFSGQGFEGMNAIPVEYALEIAEAAAYVRLTGEQPELDEHFRLKATAAEHDVIADVQAVVGAELRGDAFKGFEGFVSFDELQNGGLEAVPATSGVYLVVRPAKSDPVFLDESCGGHLKGKNPTELVDVLKAKWVAGTPVIYIGKGDNLRRRLKQYAAFGAGRRVGHWGGRYIWQLADRDELVVAWKPCSPEQTAAAVEAELVAAFKRANSARLPFANIADPSGRPNTPTARDEQR